MKLAIIKTLFADQKKVVTVKEVAEAVRCSESYVLELIHSDLLPCFMVGRHYRMILTDVLNCFLQKAAGYSSPAKRD